MCTYPIHPWGFLLRVEALRADITGYHFVHTQKRDTRLLFYFYKYFFSKLLPYFCENCFSIFFLFFQLWCTRTHKRTYINPPRTRLKSFKKWRLVFDLSKLPVTSDRENCIKERGRGFQMCCCFYNLLFFRPHLPIINNLLNYFFLKSIKRHLDIHE